MTECSNVEMQDLLPEFAAGDMPARDRESVELHLASCAPCRAELDVITAVLNARPLPPVMNVAAIVAALPRPAVPAVTTSDAPVPLRIIAGGVTDRVPSMQQTARTRRAKTSVFGSSLMRFAAVLTLVSVGGLSVMVANRTPKTLIDNGVASVVLTDSGYLVAALDVPYAPGSTPVEAVVSVAPSVLPIQELSDYSDDELEMLLERLDAWDGAPPLEPVNGAPTSSPSSDTSIQGGS